MASADVEFDGIRRVCQMACVPEAAIGDYVLVHAGVAIVRIDAAEAERTIAELSRLKDDDGWSGVDASTIERRRGGPPGEPPR